MEVERRPARVVTVRDPSRRDRPADVADALAGFQLGVQDGSRSAFIAASYEPGPLSELLTSACTG